MINPKNYCQNILKLFKDRGILVFTPEKTKNNLKKPKKKLFLKIKGELKLSQHELRIKRTENEN